MTALSSDAAAVQAGEEEMALEYEDLASVEKRALKSEAQQRWRRF